MMRYKRDIVRGLHKRKRDCGQDSCGMCAARRKRDAAESARRSTALALSQAVSAIGTHPGLYFAALRRVRKAMPALNAEERERELLAVMAHLELEAI